MVGQRALGGEADLVVEVELVGGRTAPASVTEAMLWYQLRSLVRLVPVGRPAEVGRVDVGGQPLLEAMELVGPDEVHLAGEARPVARRAQVVREGRDCRGNSAALS